MKKYYADANIFLRFLLRDHEPHYQLAKKYLESAQKEKIQIFLTTETLLEINYVLRGVYSLSRKETADKLTQIINTPYIQLVDRGVQSNAIEKYHELNVDLADLILFEKAQASHATVLSFDISDFKKITKNLSQE